MFLIYVRVCHVWLCSHVFQHISNFVRSIFSIRYVITCVCTTRTSRTYNNRARCVCHVWLCLHACHCTFFCFSKKKKKTWSIFLWIQRNLGCVKSMFLLSETSRTSCMFDMHELCFLSFLCSGTSPVSEPIMKIFRNFVDKMFMFVV